MKNEDDETFDSPAKNKLQSKVDSLIFDKLGFQYGIHEVVWLEDLKFSKSAIITEHVLYLSPAQYHLALSYYHENKFVAVKFIDKLEKIKCKELDNILGIARSLVNKSKK